MVRVVMDDGAEWEVQTRNPDLLQWDWTSTRHRWGKAEQMPMVWLTFIGWAASKREGLTTLTWDEFQKQALEVATVDAGRGGGPYEPGSRGRLIVAVALATHTAPADWWAESDATLATALEILAETLED